MCEKYIYVNFLDLLFVHPFASQMNLTRQHYCIFISHFENFYNIFNFTSGRKLWILVLSNADMLCKTRCCCRIIGKPRETKLNLSLIHI